MDFDTAYSDQLRYWLQYDSWTAHQAFCLFCLADPNYEHEGQCSLLCDPWDFDCEEADKKYHRFWSIWRSGINAGLHENEYNPPSYYIAWALSKKITVQWLNWADSNGLISHQDAVDRKIPIATDNTLISTIAALLASWPNGKPPSGKDLEKAAASVGVTISDDSIRKALKAAREIAPTLPA